MNKQERRDIYQYLSLELEATKRGLQQKTTSLQHNLTRLQNLLSEQEGTWDHYQFTVWTQGAAAHEVAEIAALLSRFRSFQEMLSLLSESERPASHE